MRVISGTDVTCILRALQPFSTTIFRIGRLSTGRKIDKTLGN
jgi:hypothetical protein